MNEKERKKSRQKFYADWNKYGGIISYLWCKEDWECIDRYFDKKINS